METNININQPDNFSTSSGSRDYAGDYAEMWYQRSWRPMMAAIYMLLCVLDYGVRPIINFIQSTNFNLTQVVQTIEPLEPIVQIEIINLAKKDSIAPILTEFVHLAFGAILGVAAFSRGSAKGFLEGSPVQSPMRTPISSRNTSSLASRRQIIDDPDEDTAYG